MLDKLTMENFSSLLNQSFKLNQIDPPVELQLVKVRALPDPEPEDTDRRRGFAVEFRGPDEPTFPQRIYRLSHPKLGDLDLFLVPVGKGRTGVLYEAVFN